MNPLRSRREHQVAWLATCLLGAVAGLVFGFVVSLSLEHSTETRAVGTWLLVWLQIPEMYWPWPIFGALGAGLATYAVRLWKISN